MRGLLAALAFLTTIPVPSRWLGDELIPPRRMLWWWAPVGAVIGALTAGVVCLAHLVLPWVSCAAIGVVGLVALSGGLHLEGFMDTCDGLGSRAPRERALEIMKDSRAGAFGVIGAVCLLLLKFALVAGMDPYWGVVALGLAPAMGRYAQVYVLWTSGYARPEGGMGRDFFAEAAGAHWVAAFACLAAAGAGLLVWPAQTAALAMVLFPLLASLPIARRLGGHTGDTVGAVSELTELAFILLLATASALV